MGPLVALLAVVGYSAAPFAIADSNVNAAVIAGVFSTVNVCIQLWNARQNRRILRQAQINAGLAIETKHEVTGARETARESNKILREATGTEKRKRDRDRRDQPEGRRRDDRE